MPPSLHNLPLTHHIDRIRRRIIESGWAMMKMVIVSKIWLKDAWTIGLIVKIARRLIENQDLGLADEGSGKRNTLLLDA